MRAGCDAAAVEARVATLVAAGAVPAPGVDPAVDGRAPFVKICGITEPVGLAAAIAAGADAIGLNFVPGTPRALAEEEAAALVAAARSADAPGNGPLLVGVFADRDPAEVAAIAARLDLDAVQLHGPSRRRPRRHPAARPQGAARPRRGRGRRRDRPPTTLARQAEPYEATRTCRPSCSTRATRRPSVAPVVERRSMSRAAIATHPGHPGRRPRCRQRRERSPRGPRHRRRHLQRRRAEPRPDGSAIQGPTRGRALRQAGQRRARSTAHAAFGPRPVDPGLLEVDAAGRWGLSVPSVAASCPRR